MAKAKTTIKKITQNAWECTKIFKTGEIEKRIVKDPIDIWSIGNTGVRNPWRIPGGYKVYVESNQVGKIRTAQEQKLFKEKLLLAGEIGGDPKKDADASITRKYRLMFNKYGFAYPEVLKKDGFSQKEIGKIDDITPAGWAFYHANTIQAQQECFLRGLVVQMEPLGERETYSPLRWVLKIRYLDYFQLYAGDKRNEMESMAVAYTERLMDTRLKIYTGKDFDYYFDTTKTSKEEYCKYLFNMTMNVVRHIGLILDYAQELSIIQGERITLNILNEASKRFYKERLVQFFEESKTAKMTYNERIESLELNKLLNQIIDKEKTIKTNIRTNQYTAVIFQKERNNPYTSHFYIAQELEPYLGSLELNFFISKYNEMSNKSGKKVSIYALNYGLCMDENLRWGKPKGNEYRTYFIESPFNFTPVIKNFLSENKKIYCENCMHEFSEEEYNLMKKYGGTCLKCGCKNSIQEKRVLSDEERSEIEEIEKKDNLLEREQYQLLKLLQYSRKDKTATELAQELDVSWQKIGWIAKKIEEDYCYLKKEPRKGKMYYVLSDLGREYLDSITP